VNCARVGLYNKQTQMRLSVVSFKEEKPTVHLRNVYEILFSEFRYCNSTAFITSLASYVK